jgi:hypothetical protein
MDGLHQFIDALYNEVHDTALAGQSLTSTWQDHPLLGPALAKMGQGHLQLLKTVHDMTTVVEKSSITLADLSWQANTINREMKALTAKGAQISASSRSLADNSSLVSADAASVAQLAQQARDRPEAAFQQPQDRAVVRAVGEITRYIVFEFFTDGGS